MYPMLFILSKTREGQVLFVVSIPLNFVSFGVFIKLMWLHHICLKVVSAVFLVAILSMQSLGTCSSCPILFNFQQELTVINLCLTELNTYCKPWKANIPLHYWCSSYSGSTYTYIHDIYITLQAWIWCEDSRSLRLPDFKTIDT